MKWIKSNEKKKKTGTNIIKRRHNNRRPLARRGDANSGETSAADRVPVSSGRGHYFPTDMNFHFPVPYRPVGRYSPHQTVLCRVNCPRLFGVRFPSETGWRCVFFLSSPSKFVVILIIFFFFILLLSLRLTMGVPVRPPPSTTFVQKHTIILFNHEKSGCAMLSVNYLRFSY